MGLERDLKGDFSFDTLLLIGKELTVENGRKGQKTMNRPFPKRYSVSKKHS